MIGVSFVWEYPNKLALRIIDFSPLRPAVVIAISPPIRPWFFPFVSIINFETSHLLTVTGVLVIEESKLSKLISPWLKIHGMSGTVSSSCLNIIYFLVSIFKGIVNVESYASLTMAVFSKFDFSGIPPRVVIVGMECAWICSVLRVRPVTHVSECEFPTTPATVR